MKKSIFLVIGLCLLYMSVIFLSCDNDSSTGGNGGNGGTQPSALVGMWNLITATVTDIITTNSNQTAIDLTSEGTGALNVTGGENAILKYVAAMDSAGVIQGMASNVPLIEIMDLSDLKIREIMKNPDRFKSELKTALTDPVYLFMFSTDDGGMFIVMENGYPASAYMGTTNGFSFNMQTYTLTATNYTLYGFGYGYPQPTVLINGQLQGVFINIPANTPTTLINQDMTEYFEGDSLAVNADGTYTGNLGDEPSAGTWQVSGTNTLMITDTTGNDTTMYFTYALSNNNFIITMDMDPCEDFDNQEDCFSTIEQLFVLDEGCITSLTEQMTMTLTKTVVAKP